MGNSVRFGVPKVLVTAPNTPQENNRTVKTMVAQFAGQTQHTRIRVHWLLSFVPNTGQGAVAAECLVRQENIADRKADRNAGREIEGNLRSCGTKSLTKPVR